MEKNDCNSAQPDDRPEASVRLRVTELTMRARVLFFGMLKEIVWMSREEAEFPEGSDLRSVFAAYATRVPPLGNLSRSIVLARNQEIADPTARLADCHDVD